MSLGAETRSSILNSIQFHKYTFQVSYFSANLFSFIKEQTVKFLFNIIKYKIINNAYQVGI